jgi:methanogenic corrinoid protein MtbC1
MEMIMSREDDILDALYDHTIDGEREPVVALTKEALELGMDPLVICLMP